MPARPPRVSTSSTKNSRVGPKAWPLSHGDDGHGTRSMVVRIAVMVVSVMRGVVLAEPEENRPARMLHKDLGRRQRLRSRGASKRPRSAGPRVIREYGCRRHLVKSGVAWPKAPAVNTINNAAGAAMHGERPI